MIAVLLSEIHLPDDPEVRHVAQAVEPQRVARRADPEGLHHLAEAVIWVQTRLESATFPSVQTTRPSMWKLACARSPSASQVRVACPSD